MTGLGALIKRNCKMFIKDKGMFFTSLITPVILLVLYVTFLGGVFSDSYTTSIPAGVLDSSDIIDAAVGGQLVSSLLAVSCVTVAFCSNMPMVQDKISGAAGDLAVTPVKRSVLSTGYFFSAFLSTLMICGVATVVCFLYLWRMGWYLSLADVLLTCLDVILLSLFGTALSSLINAPMSTQGQASAVGTIVSAGYGFICGAYMPISNFSEGLQKVLSFFPGTYGTSLIRNHLLGGVYDEMAAQGMPAEAVESMKDVVDCNLYFFGSKVEISTMYLVLGGATVLLIALYIAVNMLRKARK